MFYVRHVPALHGRQRLHHRWRRYHLSRLCQRQAHVHCNSELRIIIRRWIATHVCVRSHLRTYVRCACGITCGQDLITGGEDIIFLDCAKEKLSHAHCHSELRIIIRRWIATHGCVRSHFPKCDVRAEMRAEMRAAETSSPMAKISFVQNVPKTSSCPLQQRALHHNIITLCIHIESI